MQHVFYVRYFTIYDIKRKTQSVKNYFDWLIVLNMHLVACGKVSDVFNDFVIDTAFGKSHALFGEAAKLSQNKTSGYS